MTAPTSFIPTPALLRLGGGDIAADWQRYRDEWLNYEIATDLAINNDGKKRAAVFLACYGTAAQSVFRTFKFSSEEDNPM
jgi:hypothetical protein